MIARFATHPQRYEGAKPRPTREDGVALTARMAARQSSLVKPNPYHQYNPLHGVWQAAYDAERKELGLPCAKPTRSRPVSPARAAGLLKSPAAVAGALCNMPEFQAWAGCDSAEAAAVFVRNVCQVKSRAELNVNPAAAHVFEYQVRRLFAASRES